MTATTISYPPETQINASLTASLETGDIRLIDKLAAPWARLCKESNAEIFLTPEWIRCYLQAFEPRTRLVVISVWEGERLLAILPLTRKWIWYHGIRLLELKGAANTHAVEFDLLRLPGPIGEAAVTEVWRCLLNFPDWHILQFPYSSSQSASQEILRCAAKDGFPTLADVCADNPVLDLQSGPHGHPDPYVGTDRRFRHELRRQNRKLEARIGAPPSFRRQTEVDYEQLERFFALEAASWKGREGTAIQCSVDTLSYYRQMARVAEHKQAFSFYSLECQGRMLAASIGIEASDRYYALKMAYAQEIRNCGPGQLLISRVLEDLAQRRFRRIFFGGKMDPFKQEWTTTTEPQVNGLIFSKVARARFVYRERAQIFPAIRQLQKRLQKRLGF
jgi:CelD/BcsL family acetyltransferase involved in cellulose biosynthesis